MNLLKEYEDRIMINELLRDSNTTNETILLCMKSPHSQDIQDIMARNILKRGASYAELNLLLGANITNGLKLEIIFILTKRNLHARAHSIVIKIPFFRNKAARV